MSRHTVAKDRVTIPRAVDPACQLYLVTPPAFVPAVFAEQLKRALGAGPVACVQLRLKPAADDDILRTADLLRPVIQSHGAAFLLNDRADLVAKTGADGVHLGQTDMGFAEARRLLGTDRTIGATAHDSRHLAMEAAEEGADYVAFGAFFPTRTKETEYRPEPEILEWWSAIMTVPSVAIGGVTPQNCGALVEAGADFLAVVSAVWDHPAGPDGGVRAFLEAMAG